MLPRYIGPYDVGLATLGCSSSHTVDTKARLASGEQALVHQETVFNLFYPAQPAPNAQRGVSWALKPFPLFLQGWVKFLGYSKWILYPLVYWSSWIKIPVYSNADLLEPPSGISQWPIIMFSHGLAGSRNMYSHFCANLASEGFVVVAPDHHDGTATSWMIREADGKLTPKLYLKPTDLIWGNAEPDFKFAFRLDQLAFRRNEIYDAFSHLRNLINLGQPGSLYLISGAADSFNWARWKEAVNVNTKVTLAGHSFGGATMLSLLSNSPPKGQDELSVSGAILLDPWLEPLPDPGPKPTKPGSFDLTIVNSEAFTVWSSHFSRVEKLFSEWRGENTSTHFFTFLRSLHFSFSDIPLCLPYFRTRTLKMINRVHEIALTSIRGESMDKFIEQTRADGRLKKLEIVDEKNKKKLVGRDEDIIVH